MAAPLRAAPRVPQQLTRRLRAPQVDVLVGLRNAREDAVNVTLVTGSINNPGFFPQYLQNLTVSQYSVEVPAGAEFTLPYTFQVSPNLGPMPYTLALSVFYVAGGRLAASTALNATLSFVEPEGGLIDMQGVSMVLLFAATVAGGAYLAGGGKAQGKAKGGAKPKAKAAAVETGTAAKAPSDASEWLVGTSLHKPAKKPAPGPKKNVAKK